MQSNAKQTKQTPAQATNASAGTATLDGKHSLPREEWIARERKYISLYVRDGETAQRLAVEHYESANPQVYERLHGFNIV